MNTRDALSLMARSYPGGHESLAPRIGLSLDVFRKKLGGITHELKLSEIEALCEACCQVDAPNCHAFANAVATQSGAFVSLPVRQMVDPDAGVQRSMATVIREMSDVATATIAGDADGVISDNDLDAALKEIREAYAALQHHERSVREKHAQGKPGVVAMPLRAAG